MTFQFDWTVGAGLVTLVAVGSMALLIWTLAPPSAARGRLAAFLLVYALAFGSYDALRRAARDHEDAFAAAAVGIALLVAGIPLYLRVVGILETPLTRWLRARVVDLILLSTSLLLFSWIVLEPERAILLHQGPAGNWVNGSPGVVWMLLGYVGALSIGIVGALDAARRASPGSAARSRARSYALVFVTHDLLWIAHIAFSLLAGPSMTDVVNLENVVARATIPAIFAVMLTHAFLRWHLFDIDLRIKRGVRRGTVVAAFVLVFVVVEQVASTFVSDRIGFAGGILAAVLLALAFRPLDGLAQRFADAAMPRVAETPEYVGRRKLAIYRATVEGALADGVITKRERAMLERLRGELELQPEEAERAEREARSAEPSL